jgi:3-oxoacyl-[acyl-carrier protein] reductase
MSIPNTTLLDGRTALITGAASGIGRAIAAHYLAAGARVALADRSPGVVDTARELGTVDGLILDATDEAAVNTAVTAAADLLGRIDILVTSHGILTQSPMVDMPLAQWQETIAVDLTSVFLLNRAVLPGMLAQGGGRIINVASQLGIKGGESLTHYAAAKAGVIAMTKSLALEVSSRGVLVNAIAPGPIETPLLGGIDDDWKRAKRSELPLGRFGTADEVAPTAVLLASDPGGNLFVGQVLGPNSGDVMP